MVRILHMIKSSERAYPYDLLKKMKSKGNPVFGNLTKNDIYNAIGTLQSKGFIIDAKITGGDKRYYKITRKGSDLLKSSKVLLIKHLKGLQKLLNGV